MSRTRDAATGCLLGLACGDALGRPVEFCSGKTIDDEYGTLRDMVGDGTHKQPAGTVSDDTELALRICRSLVETGGFDGADTAARFVTWYESGPFDVGTTTGSAIRKLRTGTDWRDAGRKVVAEQEAGAAAGNGSLMRSAPYAIRYAQSPFELDAVSRRSSAITHADPLCTHACSLFTRVLSLLLLSDAEVARNVPYDPLKGSVSDPVFGMPDDIEDALSLGLEGLTPDDLGTDGHVVTTLQASLYYGLTADTAEDGIVSAVNAGGDTDTIGAVTGAIAGARFGQSGLPDRWLEELSCVDELTSHAEQLLADRQNVTAPDEQPRVDRDTLAKGVYLPARDDPPFPNHVDLPAMEPGHRPLAEPRYLPREPPATLSAADTVWFDWLSRAQLARHYAYPLAQRSPTDESLQRLHRTLTDALRIRLPEYTVAATCDELPEADKERLRELLTEAESAMTQAGETIQEIRSESNDFTALHGYLAANSREAPQMASEAVDGVSLETPHVSELLRVTGTFEQLARAYLEILTYLDESHTDVSALFERTRNAHEAATRGRTLSLAVGRRHPAVDVSTIDW